MSLTSQFPDSFPSLRLDFANSKRLDPRVTFTRASAARYYDGQTVAKAEENLLIRSQEFQFSWTYDAVTISANTTVAPDGTTTADTLAFANAATTRGYQPFTGNGSAFTFSVFAKYIDKQWIALRLTDSGSVNRFVWFDIQNGVVGTTQAGITASIVASTEGFYRCIATIATTATSNFAIINGVNGDNVTSNVGQTGSVAAWGAQLEQRSSVTAYTPTTTQPITNYIPVLMTAQAGVPRFDHNPTTAESLGLLIEEQRANLVTYSAQFDDAAWTKENSSITANTIIAPDGTLTGDKFIGTTDNSTHGVFFPSVGSAAVHTWSTYLKAGEYTWGVLRIGGASTFFNLSNGTVGTNAAGNTASIIPVGNGWYRCSVTRTLTGSGSKVIRLASADNTETFAGNGFSGIYIWGAQLEAGAFPTSYIPTVASQVTRSADAASMTGTNFSSWYNAAEGTIYAEGSSNGSSGQIGYVAVSNGTTAEEIDIRISNGVRRSFVVTNSTDQASISNGNYTAGAIEKRAVSYFVNLINAATNGSMGVEDTSALLPVVNQLRIGSLGGGAQILNGVLKKIAYYPERLTNAQLQALTS